MTTEMVNTQTGEIQTGSFTDEQVKLLKNTVCKDHTNEEFAVFLNVCKRVQLDPFAKQIYSIKYKGQMTTQTSIDGLRLIADRTDRYAPGKAPTFTYDKEGHLESATAYIMKMVGGQWFEVGATAIMKEYQNSFNQLWQKLPHAMLSKCAESNALRRAFPNETSGIYTKDEMDQAGTEAKPVIQMPRAKSQVISIPVHATPSPSNEDFLPKESASRSDEGTGQISGDDQDIEFGEPASEAQAIKEKINKAFGTKTPKLITEKQRGMLFAVSKNAGITELILRAYLKNTFNIESTKDLTMDNFSDVLAWIKKFEVTNK